MSRDHFAQYAKAKPAEYKAFSDSVWNGFVSATKVVGLGKFFSFTPVDLAPDLDPQKIGEQLGQVYNESMHTSDPL
jgi:hypothetical protein